MLVLLPALLLRSAEGAAHGAAEGAAEGAAGLTMSVYNNSAWYGAPLSSTAVTSFDQSLPLEPGATAMSVEITGSLTYVPTNPCFVNDFGAPFASASPIRGDFLHFFVSVGYISLDA
jgi:hypothetical protein